jgi:zinc transporter ZupT
MANYVAARSGSQEGNGAMFENTVWTVLTAATATAIATGLGALPFLFVRNLSLFWVSIASAVAGGLMFAATHSLVAEGAAISPGRLVVGMLLGLLGILAGKTLVHDDGGHTPISTLSEIDARKAFVLIGIMTAHSFAEGVGVGVSFGGSGELATFITAAIAVHNIPEGLAICLVLVPRGMPVWQAALWSIFTSLPQPIMAVPSYMAVKAFEPFLPMGFGIAAGAMIWMVFAELIPDANKNAASGTVGIAVTLAFSAMVAFQYLILR